MKDLKTTYFVPVFALLLTSAGCSSEGDDDGSGGSGATGGGTTAGTGGTPGAGTGGSTGGSASGSGGTGGSGMCNSSLIIADEVNNYQFSSTLTLPSVTVKPMTEIHFEWGGLTKDFLNHDVNPMTGIENINVILWQLPEAELAQKLNDDSLDAQDGQPPAVLNTMGATSADLFDFKTVAGDVIPQETFDEYLDPAEFPPAMNTYTAILAVGDLAGDSEVKMLQAFKLDPASTNSTVTITNASTTLMYDAKLGLLQPTLIPAGNGAIEIDWGDVETNAMGAEFLPTQITRARVAHYNETPAELEDKFLDLELIATATYEAPVLSGTSIMLNELKNEGGQAFPGIDGQGTWLVALFCGVCRNPAPWYLTVLKPCN
jgi:hypothetical protein